MIKSWPSGGNFPPTFPMHFCQRRAQQCLCIRKTSACSWCGICGCECDTDGVLSFSTCCAMSWIPAGMHLGRCILIHRLQRHQCCNCVSQLPPPPLNPLSLAHSVDPVMRWPVRGELMAEGAPMHNPPPSHSLIGVQWWDGESTFNQVRQMHRRLRCCGASLAHLHN